MSSERGELLDAALRALSADPTATLSDVAAAAGVRRVTLHRHFGSRDDLLRELALRSLASMDAACEAAAGNAASYTAALRAIVEALVPVGDRFHFLWKLSAVWEDPQVAARVAEQNRELSVLVDHAKQEGGIAADVPNAWVLAAVEAVVFAALSAAREGNIAVNDAGRLAGRTLFDGFRPAPKRRRGKSH
ncbi:MAG: TetR/AcrR family transcriptional regulator [Planctomycetota bacterium]|nr:MAG: TetR/AcrR family transcriptional regulator [Planctomycetota bacterium]